MVEIGNRDLLEGQNSKDLPTIECGGGQEEVTLKINPCFQRHVMR